MFLRFFDDLLRSGSSIKSAQRQASAAAAHDSTSRRRLQAMLDRACYGLVLNQATDRVAKTLVDLKDVRHR